MLRSFVFYFCLTLNLKSQINSPLSAVGIGELSRSCPVAYEGMGGAKITMASSQIINFSNPATYSSFSFVTVDAALLLLFLSL